MTFSKIPSLTMNVFCCEAWLSTANHASVITLILADFGEDILSPIVDICHILINVENK